LDQLRKVAKTSRSVLIFIHGFNNSFEDAARTALAFAKATDFGGTLLVWAWPSRGDILDYPYDKESVEYSRTHLRQLLSAIGPTNDHIEIVAHSMGNFALLAALSDLSTPTVAFHIDNVLLAAPDVPTDVFLNWIASIFKLGKRVTLYACAWDWALELSEQINNSPRAGSGGANDILVLAPMESIDVHAQWLSSNHAYVFDTRYGLADARQLIVEGKGAAERGLTQRAGAHGQFWSLGY
jgi:esterase/lipase superfamily enzyme